MKSWLTANGSDNYRTSNTIINYMIKIYLKQLFVAMIALLCCVSANALDVYIVDGIHYAVTSWNASGENNEVAVYRNWKYSGNIVIPEKITFNGATFKVTSIDGSAFLDRKELTSVTIPKSVTSIGRSAFAGCTALKSVTIPEGVTSIWPDAFYGCTALADITFPASITEIGTNAFGNTAWYDNQPDGVMYLGNTLYTYKGTMPDGTSIEIKEGTTSIQQEAFIAQKGLVNITIPNSVTTIGRAAFWSCSALTSVIIPNSVTSVEEYVFKDCSGLVDVTIPNSVTSIGGSAFNGCSSLANVTIPNSVTSIGGSAFNGCSSLVDVTIPNSVTIIGASAFKDCSSLVNITIPNSVTIIDIESFSGCTGLVDVTIPSSVTRIGYGAFYGCNSLNNVHINNLSAWCNIEHNSWSNPLNYARCLYLNGELLTSVTIPDDVKEIKNEVFVGYTELTSVTIPEGVTRIGNYAFQNCTGLTSVVLPNSVTNIGDYAFNGCNALENITFGENLEDIGVKAFYGTTWYNNQPDGLLYVGKTLYAYKGTMPDSTSIEIKEGTTKIAIGAFIGCNGLTSITIPESVTGIGVNAFQNCTALETVCINNLAAWFKVDNHNSYLFNYARRFCLNGEMLKDVVVPEEITEIKNFVFCEYDSLESITLHNRITSIGHSAFANCRSLASITIPESVTSIDDNAFIGCISLTNITIPKSVKSIGYATFYRCSRLEMVKVLQEDPQNISNITYETFEDLSPKAVLYVPAGSMEAYMADHRWSSQFKSIAEFDDNVIKGECSDDIKWTLNLSTKTLTISGKGDISDDNAHWVGMNGEIDNIVIEEGINVLSAKPFEGTNWYSNLPDDELVYIGNSLVGYKEGVGSLATVINVKEGTRLIIDDAFSNDTILEIVNAPSSLEYIGKKAFYSCPALKSIDTENVKHIGERAFYSCSALASIEMKSVETVGKQAFYRANLCSEIDLPNLNLLGEGAFQNCTSLEKVTSLGNITELPANAFDGVLLKECDIPGTVKTIGKGAFRKASLKKVIIPNSVEFIGSSAFQSNSSLDTVIIASHRVTLETRVFGDCDNIDAVYILSDSVPADGGWSRLSRPFMSGSSRRPEPRGTLYVPLGCKGNYPEPITTDFLHVVEMDMTELRQATGIEVLAGDDNTVTVNVDGGKIVVNGCRADQSVYIYSVDGRLLKTVVADGEAIALDKGIYIVRAGEKAIKVKL